jgi:hypothetical protein
MLCFSDARVYRLYIYCAPTHDIVVFVFLYDAPLPPVCVHRKHMINSSNLLWSTHWPLWFRARSSCAQLPACETAALRVTALTTFPVSKLTCCCLRRFVCLRANEFYFQVALLLSMATWQQTWQPILFAFTSTSRQKTITTKQLANVSVY